MDKQIDKKWRERNKVICLLNPLKFWGACRNLTSFFVVEK